MIATGNLTCSSPQFVPDRFGNANGAIAIRGTTSTVWTAPAGVYFTGDFTFMIWFKAYAYSTWDVFFDFGQAVPGAGWNNDVKFNSYGYGSYGPQIFVMIGTT
jgi:hypothetical protein